jgi:septal ring factor EnvC (AmiA/AmiB activator)
VFFALSPPKVVRSVLSHPVGVAAAFGVAIYTTLYHSKPIGALLIVALLVSMTRVTEHLSDIERSGVETQIATTERQIAEAQAGNSPDKQATISALNNQLQQLRALLSAGPSELETLNRTIADLERAGSRPETNDTLRDALARRAQLQRQSTPPITTPSAPAASSPAQSTPPAAPPAAPPASPARPVMACNIENFASF